MMETYQNWAEALERSFLQLSQALTTFLPHLVGALLLLVFGWLVARIVRAMLLKLGARLERWSVAFRLRTGFSQLAPWPLDRVVAGAVFWLILLFFVTAAADVLGLPAVASWLGVVINYLPQAFGGAVIVLIGYVASRPLGDAVSAAAERNGMPQAAALGNLVRIVVLVVVVLIGLEQLGLDVTLLINLATILVAAVAGGLALAFGIGAGPAVRNVVAAHYLRRSYRVGQRVRIGDIEGVILELTPTAVVLDVPDGRATVPAQRFGESASVLVPDDVGQRA